MAITAKFEVDFTSWNTAVDNAVGKLKSLNDGSVNAAAQLTKMGNAFSGSKIIQDATALTKAIADGGGAATLTAREMARVNDTVTEAIAKYKALGGTAPQSMLDLAEATKKVEPPINTFVQRLNQAKEGLTAFASGAKTIGMGLTATITAPLAAVGIAAFKASTDFETAFAGVKKTVSGTPDELAKINSEFREMAKTTPTSAVGLAKIGEMAGQLGVQKDKIVGFTKTIVDISVATNLTADEAGSAFARLANVLKLPQDQFSNLGSAVVALGNFGASTEQEMLTMAQRISAAGATAGITAPQVLGIANALSSVGIEAEAGGTAVSKVITQMASSVASGGEKLNTFAKVAGMSSAAFQKAWRDDAGTAFSTFMQGLANVREKGGDALFKVIEELGFEEVRLKNAMLSAANAGTLMADSMALGTKAFAENTELARAAEERYKTVANQLSVLWNKITDVAITLGDALVPTLLDLVKAGDPVIKWLGDAAKWFKELPDGVRTAALGFGALAAAVGPAVFVLGSLAGAMANLIPLLSALSGAGALGGMSAVVGFLGNPLVLAGAVVIGGIAVAVYQLNKNLSDLSHIPSVGKPLEGLKDANGHLVMTGEMAEKANKELGALAGTTSGPLTDGFKLTIGSVKQATTAVEAHTTAAKLSKAELKAQAKELSEVAKAHEQVRLAAVPLTAAQQAQLLSLMKLNTAAGENVISTKTMAKEIGASEVQVKVFEGSIKQAEKALDDFVGGMARTREEAEKLKPKLGGIGFKMVHEDVTLLKGSFKELHGGMSIAGDTLDHVVIPAFSNLPGHVAGAIDKINEARDATKNLSAELKGNLVSALHGIPDLFVKAFTGGGDLMGAIKAIGVQMSDAILKPIMAGMSAVKQAAVAGAVSAATVGVAALQAGASWQKALGGVALTTGAAMASTAIAAGTLTASTIAVGAATLGIGAAAIGVYVLAKHFLSVSQAEKDARKEFEAYQKHFGTLDQMIATVGQAYASMGLTGTQAQHDINAALDATHHSAQDVHNALVTINDVLIAAEERAKAIDVFNEKLTTLGGLITEIGIGIPEFLQPLLDDMMVAPGLTDDLKAAITGLRDSAGPDFAKLEQLAAKYGGTVDQLGPKFKQAHVTADAGKWISDIEKLVAAGADYNEVLGFMKDEAQAIVQQSIKFGTTIPENMRPYIQSLIDSGGLLDENKQAITDISALKFGAAVKTDVDKLKDAIELLAKAISEIPKRLGDIAGIRIPPIHVPIVYDDPGFSPEVGPSESARAAVGLSARGTVLPFIPRVSAPVLTSARVSASGGGGAGSRETLAALQGELRGLRKDLVDLQRDQLRATSLAFRAALATSPRRVA